jgi:glycosyltransferase involved in cell wall biosynthesis
LTLVPHHVDERGDIWVDRLWHRDLLAHFRYLKRVVLAAPTTPRDPGQEDLVRLAVPRDVSLTLAPLPASRSTREAMASLPALARALWRAVGEADVVHSGVAGWPIPVGWIANPIALARGRTLLVVVESAPWRTSGAAHERPQDRARELFTEALARFFVRRADVKLFTHPSYRRTLAPPGAPGCYITPAAWIEAEEIATAEQVSASWSSKRADPVRLLFAARLVPEKGVDVLLEAIDELDAKGVAARVDVIGEGPRRDACLAAALRLRHVSLRVLAPLPYGRRFFAKVRDSHAVLVPNLGDEQPRIVFDAYAQAVPVIAFDTDGIRPHVRDGETGWLVPRHGLASAIARASGSPAELERMGLAALREAPRFTHRAMHEERWRILDRALSERRFRGRRAALRPSPEA